MWKSPETCRSVVEVVCLFPSGISGSRVACVSSCTSRQGFWQAGPKVPRLLCSAQKTQAKKDEKPGPAQGSDD